MSVLNRIDGFFRASLGGRLALAALVLAAILPASGCTDGHASYTTREDIEDLPDYAQDYLRGQLETHFGTPTQIVAWEELPVHMHAAEGLVLGANASSIQSITVRADLARGEELTFLSGVRMGGDPLAVSRYTPATGEIALSDALGEPLPAAGDRVQLGPHIVGEITGTPTAEGKTLRIDVVEQNLPIDSGMEVYFVEGYRPNTEAGAVGTFDPATGVLSFEPALSGEVPNSGDQVSIGSIPAVVIAAQAERFQTFTIELTEYLSTEAGMQAVFLSGARFDEAGGRLEEPVDPETGVVRLEEELAGTVPAAGDRVVFDPGRMLTQGRMLYAEHCQHCHGVAGDGNGPTASYLSPLPRDYRLGVFKFTSTLTPNRASRADLSRIIENGIPGTYMPSFKLMEEDEQEMIIEYLLYLAMRGEMEWKMSTFLSTLGYSEEDFTERTQPGGEIDTEWNGLAERIGTAWTESEDELALVIPKQPRPDPQLDAESIARGRLVFLSNNAQCSACHGPNGLGNGPQTRALDDKPNPITGELNEAPGLYDAWGNSIQPRDLRSGIYRGGRRPLDIYRRVFAGIKGTPMPPLGTVLQEEQIWDVVNYVLHMPYEDYHTGAGADPPGTEELRALLPPPMEADETSDAVEQPETSEPEADGQSPAESPGDAPAPDEDSLIEGVESESSGDAPSSDAEDDL